MIRNCLYTLIILLLSRSAWCLPQAVDVDYVEMLRGESGAAFEKVVKPRPFVFPQDQAAHPDYRLEWWYVTGNLEDAQGNLVGFQLTFFRTALEPGEGEGWKNPQLYLGHFAVTDQLSGRHYAFERLSRTGAGLSGVHAAPFELWLDNWSLKSVQQDELFPLRLTASATDREKGRVSLDLTMASEKPVVLQGDRGFSQKSGRVGNASHYYSYTRLSARGEVRVGERRADVSGSAWLDREWSSSSLDEDQVGWDWFALQLKDGRELMFYQLRQSDGAMDPYSRGVLVERDGSYSSILPADIVLTPLEHWSDDRGSRYPIAWRVQLPGSDLDLEVRPVIRDQAWKGRFRYWEGAVQVSGSHSGKGYLELTGY